MPSVNDEFRRESRRREAALSPEARVRLALELGDADVAALSEARGISPTESRALIARRRRTGRRPSACHDDR